MNRRITVHVKRSTWPRAPRLPAFPTSFHTGFAQDDINVPSMLLLVGFLTTPAASTGISLSEFWAWVRYLAAVTRGRELRLTRSFGDLDAHQKTILSDDFGMGVPMLWLSHRLQLERIVDGRYFMQRIGASCGATQRRTAKRGPNKTPDFVARDTSGEWHVIECKGTQSGIDYCKRQLSGAIAQKRSIVFPRGHVGQRLACGLSIGLEDGSRSRLTIYDPEPEEPLELTKDQLGFADDAATRGVVSKVLRLAGFEVAAEATASPLGRSPAATRFQSRTREQERRNFVDERTARAREELRPDRRRSRLFGSRFRGREFTITLPRPVFLDDQVASKVIVRQGVNNYLLDEIQNTPIIEDPIFKEVGWTSEFGRTFLEGNERTASMSIGSLFRSELILE